MLAITGGVTGWARLTRRWSDGPKLGEATAVPVTGYMSTEAGVQGGSLSPALSEWVETLRGTASLVIPSELPAAVVGGHAQRGSGPASEAGGPLGIRVQPERPSVACILWAVERLAE